LSNRHIALKLTPYTKGVPHMDFLYQVPHYAIPFLVVLSVLVFVHEFGHYIVARMCGVRIEIFSIGFGRELFGFNDSHGTRWKICLIPLGGYVQMFGDADPTSSTTKKETVQAMSVKDKQSAFYHKAVWQRALIVAAGPFINFLYAIIMMSALFSVQGQMYSPAEIGGIVEKGPAEKAGMQIGDVITSINGQHIERFQELQREVNVNLGAEMTFVVERKGQELTFKASPEIIEQKDNFGFRHMIGRMGIVSTNKSEFKKHTPVTAVKAAFSETWSMSVSTLKAIGQMIMGTRSPDELGGVIRIGAYAKQFSDAGILSLMMFSALISVNLGLINLFPIPLLDGGHLVFYFYEAIFRRPMPEKVRMAGIRAGYLLVVTLMIYATLNDLIQLKIFSFIAKLVS
jgi:regulator of sigma E protease